ncbi:YHS domain-containing protein [Cellulomonas fimi]|uniref:YHS domain-containing protein n=1 Tax=Cellulomonas fimi TaxID=1708 RepID=A0A7Y0LY07_CELFI|nr:YHS domain-containing protein [Cellulomonas fimi]NMR20019.1 YHS domain-containing protein [Cellulomonas fimi]
MTHDHDHDHGAHDHGAHDHGAHDHGAHDHGAHDHGAHDHGGHDRGGHDHGDHDHGGHDHGGHDHHQHGAHGQSDAAAGAPAEGLAECPVMPGSMVVKEEAEAAGLTREYEGQTYYLCCDACVPMFDADPKKYAVV